MADPETIARVAQSRHQDQLHRRRYVSLPDELGLDTMDEAYQAQRRLEALWTDGGRGAVAGYKVALTSKPIQELVGVDEPCAGFIFAENVHPSGVRIAAADFIRLGVEFEMAVRLGHDMDGVSGPYDAASAGDSIEACMAAFELIEDRDADYSDLDAISLVTDGGWCGGIVLGAANPDWHHLDLTRTPVEMIYNDEDPVASVTGAAMGNPLNSLAWLANLMVGQGRPLEAGMVVMTGSTLATRFAKPGDRIRYSIDGLGSVEMSVGG